MDRHEHGSGHSHMHAPSSFGFAFALGAALNISFVVVEAPRWRAKRAASAATL